MPTETVGALTTSTTLSALFEVDFWDKVPILQGEKGKLAKFLMKLGQEDIAAKKIDYAYAQILQTIDTVVTGTTSSGLSFVVSHINRWAPNDVVLFPDGNNETAVIQAVDTATSTVTLYARQRGVRPAAAIVAGNELINQGQAYDEGATVVEPRMVQDTPASNYVQLFWQPVSFTGTQIAINNKGGMYGGDYVKRKRNEKMIEHLQKQDHALMWGESAQTGDRRTMGGIDSIIDATKTSTIATMARNDFEQFLEEKALREGDADNMVFLTSYFMARGMNRWGTDVIRTNTGGTEFGYRMDTYLTQFGDMKLMPHYNFLAQAHKGIGFAINLTDIAICTLRKMKLYVDIDVGTKDVKMDAFLTEQTARWGHPLHHSKSKGTTAFA
jgi:hypothetical protein